MFDFDRYVCPSLNFSFSLIGTLVLGSGLLLLGGCDSGGAMQDSTQDESKSTIISGTVTDDGSKALRKSAFDTGVEGATVTAVRVNNDGSTTSLDASTETGSDGTFELTIEQQAEGATVVVKAEKSESSFSSSVGVQITDPAETAAQPMTEETHAEAQVATRMNKDAGDSEEAAEALADAAAMVDNDVANAILSGNTTPSEIATLARSMDQTREEYASDAGVSASETDVAKEEQDAYEQLQEALSTANDSAARAEALQAFEQAMASSYEEAGVSTDLQAKIQQAGTQVALTVVDNSSLPEAAKLGLERRATVLRAIATGKSVESTIENNGTNSGIADEVKSDRSALLDSVRSASSQTAIENARASYQDAAKSNLESAFDMSQTDVEKGFESLQTPMSALEDALNTAISTTDDLDVNADAVSTAFQNFYKNGMQSVEEALSSRGAAAGPANSAAKVTTKTGVF